jgi:hypothetical protein
VKTFEVCDLPVRAAKFVARKNWVVTGAVSNSEYQTLPSDWSVVIDTSCRVVMPGSFS